MRGVVVGQTTCGSSEHDQYGTPLRRQSCTTAYIKSDLWLTGF